MVQQVIGDRYEILSRLGSGGMASVYRARDTRLRREVAIKVVDIRTSVADSGFLFHREARAIAALRHYNIVQVYDYSGPEESPVFMVMELIDGRTLSVVIDGREVPESFIAGIGASVAGALEHAHDKGVVHRDVKPANILIEASGRVLLTDFGVAKPYRDPEELGGTVSGRKTGIMGTPSFMAPEQITEDFLGPATDIFALASVLYAVAVGHSPFSREESDVVEVLRRIVDVEYVPLPEACPGASSAMVQLIEACLVADPKRRPTATDVMHRCEELLSFHGFNNAERAIIEFLELDRTKVSGPIDISDLDVASPPTLEPGAVQLLTDEPPPTVSRILPRHEPSVTEPAQASESTETPEVTVRVQGPPMTDEATERPGDNAVAAGVDSWEPPEETTTRVERPGELEDTTSAAASPVVVEAPKRRWLYAGVAGLAGVLVVLILVSQRDPQVTAVTPLPPASADVEPETEPSAPVIRVPEAPAEPAPQFAPESPSQVTPVAPPDPTDVDSPPAKATVRRPTRRATIEVHVRPWGTVTVDGKEKGNTPLVRQLTTTAGKHTIVVEHPKLGKKRQTVVLKGGERRVLRFDLRP